MIALSDVSREAMYQFHQVLPTILQLHNIRSVYEAVLNMFDTLGSFVRLWAWERMYMTIHGPRLLETANTIFGRIREVVKASFPEKHVSDTTFDAIESLCHSYMLASAMYTQNEETQMETAQQASTLEHAQNVSFYTKDIVLNSIFQLVRN